MPDLDLYVLGLLRHVVVWVLVVVVLALRAHVVVVERDGLQGDLVVAVAGGRGFEVAPYQLEEVQYLPHLAPRLTLVLGEQEGELLAQVGVEGLVHEGVELRGGVDEIAELGAACGSVVLGRGGVGECAGHDGREGAPEEVLEVAGGAKRGVEWPIEVGRVELAGVGAELLLHLVATKMACYGVRTKKNKKVISNQN